MNDPVDVGDLLKGAMSSEFQFKAKSHLGMPIGDCHLALKKEADRKSTNGNRQLALAFGNFALIVYTLARRSLSPQ